MKKIVISILFFAGMVTSAQASLQDYFVSTEWLASNRNSVRVVDVRNQASFLLGHIEGAVNTYRDQFLDRRNGTKSLIPTAEEFVALMNRIGVNADTTVVAYAADHDPYSARFIWTLRYYGHEKAYVLDGGYDKWAQEDRPTAFLPSDDPAPADYRLNKTRDIRAEGAYVLSCLDKSETIIWDTRRTSEYEGSEVRADRGGHIPGSTNLNWTELQQEVNGVRVLKSEADIRALLASYGLTPDKEILAHCQTGIRSSYATLVLLGLGYPQAKNYDGSWIEWANNKELPIVDPSNQ